MLARFGSDALRVRAGVAYRFVRDDAGKHGGWRDRIQRISAAARALHADVLHVNGMQFAWQARFLKKALGGAPVLLQDHAEWPPRRPIRRLLLRAALSGIDAVAFTAAEQAAPWRQAGLLGPETQVFALMEGSSHFQMCGRSEARSQTGLEGDPLCLWVGRMDRNKDPITVLEGFALACAALPGARLAMVYGTEELLPAVRRWLQNRPEIAASVLLLGRRPHPELERLYNSADLFIVGSHHEGSGYAVLEALSCGVLPVLTDIPSFRVLTDAGAVGVLWPVEDRDACARALCEGNRRRALHTPDGIRAYFESRFSFAAIGREALAAYRALHRSR